MLFSFCWHSITWCSLINSPKWSTQRFLDKLGRTQSTGLQMGKKNIRLSGVLSTQSEHFTIHPSLLIFSFQNGLLPWQPATHCPAIVPIHIAPLAERLPFLCKAVIGLTFMIIHQMSCWNSIFLWGYIRDSYHLCSTWQKWKALKFLGLSQERSLRQIHSSYLLKGLALPPGCRHSWCQGWHAESLFSVIQCMKICKILTVAFGIRS